MNNYENQIIVMNEQYDSIDKKFNKFGAYSNFIIMKRLKDFRLLILATMMIFGMSFQAKPQCTITADKTKSCKGQPVTFSIPMTTSFHHIKWKFTDDDSSTQNSHVVSFVYDTFGHFCPEVILYNSDNSVKCSSTMCIDVYDNPHAKLILPAAVTMCFEDNKFCFKQSSKPGKTNAPVSGIFWDFGDGDSSSSWAPCKSYMQSGVFTIRIYINDTNGCIDTASAISSITVLPKLAPKFKSEYKVGCPETVVKFINTTDSTKKGIVHWWWDFGDGTKMHSDTAGDSIWGAPKLLHVYKKDGIFNPKLTIESAFGCRDSFIFYSGARNIFYYFDIVKDNTGPICWQDNEVCFKQTPRPKAYYWLWTFDDPPSMIFNTNDESWSPCHNYTAPGYYDINLKIWEPNCIRDTTFCIFIPLKGPMARINTPPPPAFPANNQVQAKPITIADFVAAASNCYDIDGDGVTPDNITYARRSFGAPYLKDTLWDYCSLLLDTALFDTAVKPYPCYDTVPPRILNINYWFKTPPTNYQVIYDSIYETYGVWKPGDPLPAGFTKDSIFWPIGGSVNLQTMHDTDIYTPNCQPPNYVRFTNNSLKYRLYFAIDNEPLSYFPNWTGKKSQMRFDTCRNPSYPWASDSMDYFWNFQDGDQCTSTVNKPNLKCRYSTEVAPWHLFTEKCPTVQLKVWDAVTQCESRASQFIINEPPDASWDENVWHYLSWKNQRQVPSALGHRGVWLNGTPCVGFDQLIIYDETLPSCQPGGQTHWWLPDSTDGCATGCQEVIKLDADGDGIKETTRTISNIQCGWIPQPILALLAYTWRYSTPGWKTPGFLVKTGDCYDTFFYSKYKYIFPADPNFNINNPYKPKQNGVLPPYSFANEDHYRFCPPHQLVLTVADTTQIGITKFHMRVDHDFWPPWITNTIHLVDSQITQRPDTAFIFCHKDSFDIDPFTGKKYFRDCRLYPELERGKVRVPPALVSYLISNGWFVKDTMPTYTLQDTLFMKDSNATFTTKIESDHSLFLPGRYKITTTIKNIYGCERDLNRNIIVGHYTELTADKRMICYEGGGDTVTFTHKIRYFYDPIFPWDPDTLPVPFWLDPYGYRTWTPTPGTFIPENVEFDLDGDGVYETPRVPKSDKVSFIYKSPGNYTVRMKSMDSNGCIQVLEYPEYIQVMGADADFVDATPDTLLPHTCSPEFISFKDISQALNNKKYYYNSSGIAIDSQKVDSVIRWWWYFGDNLGSSSESRLQNPGHSFIRNGLYDIKLIVKTQRGCVDTIIKKDFILIKGPDPKFWIMNDGYPSLADTICEGEFIELIDSSTSTSAWLWTKGDGTTEKVDPDPVTHKAFIQYTKAGIYTMSLTAIDSVLFPGKLKKEACLNWYGDTNKYPEDPTFTVNVMRNANTEFDGDTLICDSTYAEFNDLSDNLYKEVYWNFYYGTQPDWDTATQGAKAVHQYVLSKGSYDSTFVVALRGGKYACPGPDRTMSIRVVKAVAEIGHVDTSGIPLFTFRNKSGGVTGATKFRWTVVGLEDNNNTFTQELVTTDTMMYSVDFGNLKGDYRVCLETWVTVNGLGEEACIKKDCRKVNNHYKVELEMPNVFTPGDNNDVNDVFKPVKVEGVEIWDMKIYNRWGERVFESTDPEVHWNGDNKNTRKACAGGTYYYVLKYQLRGQKLKDMSGTVTLIR